MQLLEREDEKKWWVWIANGLVSQQQKLKTKIFPFFDKFAAIALLNLATIGGGAFAIFSVAALAFGGQA